MKINRIWRGMAVLLTTLLLVCCFGTTAFAYEAIGTGRETSLTVYFGKGGNGFTDVEFRVYRVAEVSAGARFTLTGDFADYPVKVNGLDSSGWRALAQTLEGYAARDNLSPLKTEGTGRDGKAVFSHLETGLYLVTGDRYRQGRYTYTPEPFLIALPTLDEADAWVYDAVVSCKYDSDYTPPGGGGDDDTVNRKVLKVWEDDGNEDKRPDEIVVQLLRNGKVYDTVTLNDRLDEKIGSSYAWLCQCDCGKQLKVGTAALLSEPGTRSCGCGRVEAVRQTIDTHGTVADHCHFVDGTCIEKISDRKKLQKNNTSGCTGVQVRGKRYIASINFKRKTYYLGSFSRFEDAVRVRKQAEERMFGEFLDEYYASHPPGEHADRDAPEKEPKTGIDRR